MTKKKKIIFISAGAAAVLVLLIIIWFFIFRKSSSAADGAVAYTAPVSMLTTSATGMVNRYAGVVEPQKTVKFKKPLIKMSRRFLSRRAIRSPKAPRSSPMIQMKFK